ncbi:putative IS1 encoded protein [Escherichia coli DEC14D]|nr:putative IS1 encoded protein [Escherichia coli DEC14D]EHX87693.1 putative IS1 encoded protein [Escherichia coli DEC14D]
MSGSAFAVTHHAFSSGAGRTSDGNGSHASTLKSPSYTKSVSWQHYQQLDDLEVQRNLPRADLLREAVDQYLINQSQTARTSVPGIWQGCEEDGVEYQRKLREEW